MEIKCDSCRKVKRYTLGPDEVGGGCTTSYCSKNHWDMEYPDEEEYNDIKNGIDPREDCEDYVSTKQQVYVLMGLPGAGKTTWAKKKAEIEKDTIIVSRDGIRYMLKNGYVYNNSSNSQELVSEMSLILLEKSLQKGFNVIIDQLSLTTGQRWDTANDIKILSRKLEIDTECHLLHFVEEDENVQRRLNSDMCWGDETYYKPLIETLKNNMNNVEKWEDESFETYSQVDKNGVLKKIW